ncbi:hypothetical protein Tco_0002134 [Tanacetum coccineum]
MGIRLIEGMVRLDFLYHVSDWRPRMFKGTAYPEIGIRRIMVETENYISSPCSGLRDTIPQLQSTLGRFSKKNNTIKEQRSSSSIGKLRVVVSLPLGLEVDHTLESKKKWFLKRLRSTWLKLRMTMVQVFVRLTFEEAIAFEMNGQFLKELRENTFSGT